MCKISALCPTALRLCCTSLPPTLLLLLLATYTAAGALLALLTAAAAAAAAAAVAALLVGAIAHACTCLWCGLGAVSDLVCPTSCPTYSSVSCWAVQISGGLFIAASCACCSACLTFACSSLACLVTSCSFCCCSVLLSDRLSLRF